MGDKYDVSDLEFIRIMIEDIISIADRTTSGNVLTTLQQLRLIRDVRLKRLTSLRRT